MLTFRRPTSQEKVKEAARSTQAGTFYIQQDKMDDLVVDYYNQGFAEDYFEGILGE